MKYIITVILTALIVGFSVTAYFKGWLPSVTFNEPRAVSVRNTEVYEPKEIEDEEIVVSSPSPTATTSATPSTNDNKKLLDDVRIGLVAKNGQNFNDYKYSVSKVEGNYASGTVNGDGGGGMWFAAKVGNTWKVVSDGNGVILCSSLSLYPNFPKTIIPECWDDVSGKTVKR